MSEEINEKTTIDLRYCEHGKYEFTLLEIENTTEGSANICLSGKDNVSGDTSEILYKCYNKNDRHANNTSHLKIISFDSERKRHKYKVIIYEITLPEKEERKGERKEEKYYIYSVRAISDHRSLCKQFKILLALFIMKFNPNFTPRAKSNHSGGTGGGFER